MSMIEQLVAQKILKRGEFGEVKYGISMAEEQLPFIAWMTHLQQELMDACVYIEKVLVESEMDEKFLQPGECNQEIIADLPGDMPDFDRD